MKKDLDGYMTVEISMLFPIIFLTICLLFYMCFCFHDRVVSQAFLYRFGIHSNFQNLTEKEMESELRKGIDDRMIMSDLMSAEFSVTDFNIKARVSLKFNGVLLKNKKSETKVIIENMNKSDNLRKFRLLKEVTD